MPKFKVGNQIRCVSLSNTECGCGPMRYRTWAKKGKVYTVFKTVGGGRITLLEETLHRSIASPVSHFHEDDFELVEENENVLKNLAEEVGIDYEFNILRLYAKSPHSYGDIDIWQNTLHREYISIKQRNESYVIHIENVDKFIAALLILKERMEKDGPR